MSFLALDEAGSLNFIAHSLGFAGFVRPRRIRPLGQGCLEVLGITVEFPTAVEAATHAGSG